MSTDHLPINQWFERAKHARGLSLDITNSNDETSVGNFVPEGVECSASFLSAVVTGQSNSIGCSGSYVYVQSDQQTIADNGVGDASSSPLYRYVYSSYIDEPVVNKGAGAKASWEIIGGTEGLGCLTRKTGCLQGNIQGALPIGIGGGITLPGGWGPTAPALWPPSSYGVSIGPGSGIALTAEDCWTF